MTKRRSPLPLILGLLTVVLLAAVLWPKQAPQKTVAVAAADLGAGQTLAAADLVTVKLDAAQAPADALGDPAKLVGQTLAVVRYKGEPVTPRHLGPAVTLAANERGLAVKVKADTGLAGLLRPGMRVGVIGTLGDRTTGALYAKTVLEGLRVLYVSPDFQARPYAPATASGAVSPGGALDGGSAQAGSTGTVREGVLVLAAGTQLEPIRYEQVVTDTIKTAPGAPVPTATPAATATRPGVRGAEDAAPVQWVVPVELLAALNAAGDSLTLTLLPPEPQPYTSIGVLTGEIARPTRASEVHK